MLLFILFYCFSEFQLDNISSCGVFIIDTIKPDSKYINYINNYISTLANARSFTKVNNIESVCRLCIFNISYLV